jgi:hypothetical protein
VRRDRRQQIRIARQRVDPREIRRQLARLQRQHSSHNNSTCPASKRGTRTPKIAHKPTHLQANHPVQPGQNPVAQRRLFPGK